MNPPPDPVTRISYPAWLRAIGSDVSAFMDLTFNWRDAQLQAYLPPPVVNDPDKLYVAVDQALAQTISLENNGDIEEGNTVGFDAYALAGVPIAAALETLLFFCGKPLGKAEGETYPFDTIFGRTHCSIKQESGAGNYTASVSQTNAGGFVEDLNDDYTILVRGNAAAGYQIFSSFSHKTGGEDTATVSNISLFLLKAASDGTTDFRHSMRRNGQSYKVVGLENGRRNYGFNIEKVRKAEIAVIKSMSELKNTGAIRENRP